jgi:hypothetical protein
MFDVVIFNPNKIKDKSVNKRNIYEMNFVNKLDMQKFPTTSQSLVIETTAYTAESELTDLLYDGSAGIYRDHQFKKARVAYLKPMREEIDILWGKEVNLRQGFAESDGLVTIPAIFANIIGVKGTTDEWCKRLTELLSLKDYVFYNYENEIMGYTDQKFIHSAEVIRSKKIDVQRLREHKNYNLRALNDDMQLYLIDRLQEFLDSGIIKGVYTKGVENDVLDVFGIIGTNYNLIRLIQNFDFTKINPKVVYVWMKISDIPKKDIILLHYLNFLGFDVLVFVPTGYNVMKSYITQQVFTEYIEGNSVAPFEVKLNAKQGFFNKLFNRR